MQFLQLLPQLWHLIQIQQSEEEDHKVMNILTMVKLMILRYLVLALT